MNPLFLAGGLALVQLGVRRTVNRVMLGAGAYVALFTCGLVAVGFVTAAGYLYLAQTNGAILACVIVAGIYALAGTFGFFLLLLVKRRRRRLAISPAITSAASAAEVAAIEAFPGGLASVGLLAVAGYLMARSMTRK